MKKLFSLIALAFTLLINAQEQNQKTDSFQKTDEVLSQVVKKALTVAEKTGEFVIEQAPLLLQEFYNWHIAESIFYIILSIILSFVAYKVPLFWLSDSKKESYYSDNIKFFGKYGGDGGISAWIFFVLMNITSLHIFISNTHKLVFILTAPKLYLIEYFLK